MMAAAVLCAGAAVDACQGAEQAGPGAQEAVVTPSATPPAAPQVSPVDQGSSDASAPVPPGSVSVTLFDDIGKDMPSGPRRETGPPFSLARRMPEGTLGTRATDASIRATLASFCHDQKQAFLQHARSLDAGPSNSPTSTVANSCHCVATLATARWVSVACSDRAELGSGPAARAFRGFSFAIAGGSARPLDFAEVCAPVAECAHRLHSLYVGSSLARDSSDDLGHAPSPAAIEAYFAHPVFVLLPGALRVEMEEKLTGRASEGFALEITSAALGPLYLPRATEGADPGDAGPQQ